MKVVHCDICGKLIPLESRFKTKSKIEIQAAISRDIDVCPACQAIGATLDHASILMDAWKKAVKPETRSLPGRISTDCA